MRRYLIGYVALTSDCNSLKPVQGKFFKIYFKPRYGIKEIEGYRLVVQTKDYKNARRASQLIASAISLLDACAFYTFDSIPQIIPLQKDEEEIPRFSLEPIESSRSGFPTAVKIAAKASFQMKFYLSLLKYQIGCEIHSNDLMDLYPEYTKISKNPADHLRIAYAVILFYSLIEELGLEIKASKEIPSRIGGRWNTLVKAELEERLKKSKIDLTKKIDWYLRSTPTKIEKLRKPDIINKAPWSSYNIRDSEIQITDGIAYASWLRSKIASHKINQAFTSLSIYDLANVNHLVRRLLLESLGFF